MISYNGSVEDKIEERFKDKNNAILGIVKPQVIVQEKGKSYFYTSEGVELSFEINIDKSEYVEIINSTGAKLLLGLEKKINSSNVIYVENNGNPRLINTCRIKEVQLIFE